MGNQILYFWHNNIPRYLTYIYYGTYFLGTFSIMVTTEQYHQIEASEKYSGSKTKTLCPIYSIVPSFLFLFFLITRSPPLLFTTAVVLKKNIFLILSWIAVSIVSVLSKYTNISSFIQKQPTSKNKPVRVLSCPPVVFDPFLSQLIHYCCFYKKT